MVQDRKAAKRKELDRVERAYRAAGQPLGTNDFWISARRDGGIWTEH
jgi:hypothetical protein